ncbi:putative bifunctional diguanylate cyclase/phosphodiesterase [Methylophilus aquaticus]|uniref:Bifunctional diguanylate cyclase/phosphodiesterase n=1 Tax=Methylophilus aquaticus TaxID=1971610 RepID=A0ABT9JS28_9PROT|nr:bifunctional diguanylate cyclase/phosphodiesterase [Methylophilus aquaticus]MDP8567373.1 bifunctional diguanylate cyclase/phosphodiesterase [Methylophilus aquaticus]
MTVVQNVTAVAVSVLLLTMCAYEIVPSSAIIILDNIHWLSTNIFGALLAWLGYRHADNAQKPYKKWFLIGATSYLIGGLLWVAQTATHFTTFPAPSDLFYLLLGPGLIIGFLIALKSQLSRSKTIAFTIDALSFTTAVLGYVLVTYLPKSGHVDGLQLAVLAGYPVSMLSAGLVSLLMIPYLRPALMLPWVQLSLGLLLSGLCWMQWNLNALNHVPQNNPWLNFSFSVFHLLIGLGLYGWHLESSNSRSFQRQCMRMRAIIPLIAFVFSIGTLVLITSQNGPHPYAYNIAIASVICILLFSAMRQSILLRESERLLIAEQRLADKEYAYEHLAQHDPLTNLPNRHAIQLKLEHALIHATTESQTVALVLIDLSRFKAINDSFGHHTGDLFLINIAKRLQQVATNLGEVGRMHSDKFALIVTARLNESELIHLVQSLMRAVNTPTTIDGHELILETYIGISLFPKDASHTANLTRNAHTALNVAKQRGGNQYQFYAKEQTKLAQSIYHLDIQLRKAIQRHEFFLEFQPIFELQPNGPRIKTIEALIRWKKPKGEIISPATFIPYAEEVGLIVPIGEWVIEHACRTVSQLSKQLKKEIGLSINISPKQFRDQGLSNYISLILHAFDLDPATITLEITESAVFEQEEQALEILQQMKKLGVRIALDDFGVGNSSLFKLKHLPIDDLKIDRAFLTDVPESEADKQIIQTITKTAHILGLSVVVEGVETQAQFDFLQSLGCDQIQGFLLGRPCGIEQIKQLLEESERHETSPV